VPRRWLPRGWHAFASVAGALAIVVGAGTNAQRIWHWISPPPPPVTGFQIESLQLERGVSFQQYLARVNLPRGTLSRDYLRRRGVLVTFRYRAEGYAGRSLPLRAQLVDEQSHDVVGDPVQGVAIRPGSATETRDWYVWSAVPATTRRYRLHLKVFQPDGVVPLQDRSTPVFSGLR
jgi:hypothetical protein